MQISTKVYWNFYGIVKIRVIMINNVNILTKCIFTTTIFTKIKYFKTKVPEKAQAIWALFLAGWLKLYDKMAPSIRMEIIYNVKHVMQFVWNLETNF